MSDNDDSGDVLIKRRKNHIWINSEINAELLMAFQEKLLEVAEWEHYLEESYTPVTLHIHSPGGDMFSGLAIYDLLHAYSGDVTTVVEGFAGSAASLIFMAGKKRYIRPSGFLHIHEASLGIWAKYKDIKDTVVMMDLSMKRIHSIYRVASGQSKEKVDKWLSGETWFDQELAVANGLAELLTSSY